MDSSQDNYKRTTYVVTADYTEGCRQRKFAGMYRLKIGEAVIRLLQYDSGTEITNWPLHGIKKFGFTSETFFLYAGTRCEPNSGKFIFFTSDGKEISAKLSSEVSRILNKEKTSESVEIMKTHRSRSNNYDHLEPGNVSPTLYTKLKQDDFRAIKSTGYENVLLKDEQPAKEKKYTTKCVPSCTKVGGESGTNTKQRHNLLTGSYSGLQEGSSAVLPPVPKLKANYQNYNQSSHQRSNEINHTHDEYGVVSTTAQCSFSNEGAIFPANSKQEDDYYNSDVYSHLHDNVHFTYKEYDILPAATQLNSARREELSENADSSD